MKTLKQQAISFVDIQEMSFNSDYDNSLWITLEQVKEWLTQKRQNALERGLYTMIYDDLLEELK